MDIILAILIYMTVAHLYFSQVINPVDVEMEKHRKNIKP